MTSEPKGEKDGIPDGYFVELETPLDFGRQMATFDGGARHVNAIKEGGGYRLFAACEKVGGVRLLYCITVKNVAGFAVYNPGIDSTEGFEVRDFVSSDANYKMFHAPVVRLSKNPYRIKDSIKAAGKIELVGLEDYRELTKALANGAAMNDSPVCVYAFFHKSAHYIGTFDLFHEGGSRVFSYARLDTDKRFISLGYNYNDGSVSASDTFSGHSHVYVGVVNMKGAFPFFKP